MKWQLSLLSLALMASQGWAQAIEPVPVSQGEPVIPTEIGSSEAAGPAGFLTSDRAFPNFIGYLSNPVQAIDPRALSQISVIVANTWTGSFGPLPGGDIFLPGPAVSLALSDRLSLGINRGGYVWSNFRTSHDGLLNLGGYVQYTVIRDVPNQFLLTAGIEWQAPTGESSVFQGHGPAYLAPYVTVGKEFGEFHVLNTVGYQFPTGSGTATTNTWYGNFHVDRRMFCWLYPVLEVNWSNSSSKLDLTRITPPGFIGIGEIDGTGTLVTVAPGVNAVLVPGQLEVGLSYETPIYSQRNLHMDVVLMKMNIRF